MMARNGRMSRPGNTVVFPAGHSGYPRAWCGVLLSDYFPGRVEYFVDVHKDAVFFHCFLAMLVQQEVECLSESTLASGAKQVKSDAVAIGVATPDDAKRLEQITVNMQSGRKGLSEFRNTRRGHVDNTRGRSLQPRVGKNLWHLFKRVSGLVV